MNCFGVFGQSCRRRCQPVAIRRTHLRNCVNDPAMQVQTAPIDIDIAATLPPGTLELGSGEPIVLFHGILGSPVMWREVLPLLAASHRAIALPALGHIGGRRCERQPVRFAHVVDDAERSLDALGLERAHLAGNSLGGWLALELSRRRRALSVSAFSPAGMWEGGVNPSGRKKLEDVVRVTRASRSLLPWTARISAVRRFALRDNAVRGDRISPAMLVELADAVLTCPVAEDLLATTDAFAPLEITCPTQIVWGREDRIFPWAAFTAAARLKVPDAHHSVLSDVGHVPMLDNPTLVADTILKHVAGCVSTDRPPI
jgi:pimeloyl-ACP methyl ester carboxylesterase